MRTLEAAISVWVVVACAAPAWAVDLNSSLNDRPTVGSEVKRGFKAAFHCMTSNNPFARKIADCVDDAASNDEQRHADSTPFRLGLYYGACVNLSTLVKTDTDLQKKNSAARADLEYAKIDLKYAYEQFRLVQKKIGLSDEQVVQGTGMLPEGRSGAIQQLRNWVKSPPT